MSSTWRPGDLNRVRNVIAPTLRGLAADADHLPVVTSLDLTGVAELPPGAHVLDLDPAGSLAEQVTEAFAQAGVTLPRVVAVPGLVAFGIGVDLSSARGALAGGSDSGVRAPGRMAGKVVVVTGAAQGFGLGITSELLSEGASVVLADLNYEVAAAKAEQLSSQHGEGRAVAVAVNVADAQSQLDAAAEVVALFGGLDLFVSNAGVLRAEGVMTQPVADFDLVTDVNYRGYFLGVRAIAPIMAAQHAACPTAWFDIIEINSKSGLEGSKRNFAYSGSKFGGIGLTQSFALELVEYGIKVNAICPGNYLDGPLWTDPERGLFVQYLRAGKVPGATTVADVRKFYEQKVPIGRGCLPSDLAKAIYYVVEQGYETGQAIPVTGGQNMLS